MYIARVVMHFLTGATVQRLLRYRVQYGDLKNCDWSLWAFLEAAVFVTTHNMNLCGAQHMD